MYALCGVSTIKLHFGTSGQLADYRERTWARTTLLSMILLAIVTKLFRNTACSCQQSGNVQCVLLMIAAILISMRLLIAMCQSCDSAPAVVWAWIIWYAVVQDQAASERGTDLFDTVVGITRLIMINSMLFHTHFMLPQLEYNLQCHNVSVHEWPVCMNAHHALVVCYTVYCSAHQVYITVTLNWNTIMVHSPTLCCIVLQHKSHIIQ